MSRSGPSQRMKLWSAIRTYTQAVSDARAARIRENREDLAAYSAKAIRSKKHLSNVIADIFDGRFLFRR